MEESRLIEAFKWLHQHPELAMEEKQTTEFVRGILSENGVRLLETGLETGLIAEVGTGKGPVIALRADMDALPIREETGLPYASERPGVMHACGHDFHTACMLGATLLLKEKESSLPGTVKVIFQPSEEVNNGAALMISTGLLNDVQLFLSGHTYPWYRAGILGIRPGPVMAAADRFAVRIRGKGCHAANPERGNDPILAMAAVITAFQTLISRRTNPFDSAVVSITRAEAGNTWNVIPETAILEGTVRAMTEAVREDIRSRMEQTAADTAKAYGCEAAVEYERGPDPVVNDTETCERAADIARRLGMRAETNPPSMIAEDFSEYLRLAPGAMFRVGTGGNYDNHHPSFTADPSALFPAARFFAALAEKELERIAETAESKAAEKTGEGQALLRYAEENDLPEVIRTWPSGHRPVPEEEARDAISYMRDNYAKNTKGCIYHLCLAVCRTENRDTIMGWCGLDGRRSHTEPEIFILLDEEYRNKGYGTQCVKELLRIAAEDYGLRSVHGGCDKGNIASRRAMEKGGMDQYGTEDNGDPLFMWTAKEENGGGSDMKFNGKTKKSEADTADKNTAEETAVKAGKLLSDEEAGAVTGAGNGLWMVSGDPECDSCDGHPKMSRYYEEGNLITYICPLCLRTVTLFDQG